MAWSPPTFFSLLVLFLVASTALSFAVSSSHSLQGKTVLVTGSTDGIGEHTAKRLATEGAKVLLHGRSEQRVQRTLESVSNLVKGKTGCYVPEAYTADLSTLKGMHSLCDQIQTKHKSLDILINNAGVFEPSFKLTEDNLEYTFAVNVMAPFVITHRLLPLLREGLSSGDEGGCKRIINVSSMSQAYSIDLDNLQCEKGGFSNYTSYALSKIAIAMFNRELHERLNAAGEHRITANSLDPGTVNTKMLDAGWGMCGMDISHANDQFWLATSAEVEGVSGNYYVSRRLSGGAPPIMDDALREGLWQRLEALSGIQAFFGGGP